MTPTLPPRIDTVRFECFLTLPDVFQQQVTRNTLSQRPPCVFGEFLMKRSQSSKVHSHRAKAEAKAKVSFDVCLFSLAFFTFVSSFTRCERAVERNVPFKIQSKISTKRSTIVSYGNCTPSIIEIKQEITVFKLP